MVESNNCDCHKTITLQLSYYKMCCHWAAKSFLKAMKDNLHTSFHDYGVVSLA